MITLALCLSCVFAVDAFSLRYTSPATVTRSSVNSDFHAPMRGSVALKNLNEDIDAVMMMEQRSFSRPAIFTSGSLAFNKEKLKNAGASGLVSYGLLNCLYYTVVTAIVWFTMSSKEAAAVADMSAVSAGFMMKLKGNLTKFPKVMVLVWAGSQATKVFRISGSLFITPWTASVLEEIQKKLRIPQSKAVALCSSALLGFTAAFYAILLIVTSL